MPNNIIMSKERFKEEPNKTPEQLSDSEQKDQFRSRIEQLVPIFLSAREKMGINEDVGFGSLPRVHSGGDTLGCLPDIIETEAGKIEYSIPGLLTQTLTEELTEEQRKNIPIMPDLTKSRKGRIVSIYDPYSEWDKDKKFGDIPDEVYVGVIAHELAHSFNSKTKFSQEMIDALQASLAEQYPSLKGKWGYDTTNEEAMDLIAALFGYKEQIIAKIDFMIGRFNKMGPYFKNKERVIKSLEVRKQHVLKFCP
jgi:hypothetical protein